MRAFPCQSAVAFPASLPRRSRASLLWRSLATAIPLRRLLLCHGAPASSLFATTAFPACLFTIAVPRPASLPLRTGRPAALPQRPGQQKLRHSAGQQLRYGAPASNKPHPAEKSTPVWLAIWRTWAGFANSQLLPDAAALSSMQGIPRSSNIFRTDFRFAPSLPHRFACGPIPFTRTWASTVCAEEFPTPREMSLHGLHLLRQTQICRPICTDCLRHLRISAK